MLMLVLQNVIVLSVNLADNIMIGMYSETALSGVAAVNQIQFIFQQLIIAAGDTLVTVGSQYWGQKRTEPIKRLTVGAIILALSFGTVFFLAMTFFPRNILSTFTPSEAIIAAGEEYVRIIRFTYPILALSTVLLASMRSVETVKIAFFASAQTLVINCAINYLLIGGHLGAPRLGVTGAAIGTLCARTAELAVVAFYYLNKEKKISFKLRDLAAFDKSLLRDYFRTSVFIVIAAGMFGASTALQTVVLGHMNDSAIAANSVASTLFQLLKVASVGASSAAAVIIGKTIGEGRNDRIKPYTVTLQIIFLSVGVLTSVFLNLLRLPILSLYDLSPETKSLASSFILVLCVTCIGTAYEMPVLTGIVRGGGDTRFVFINDLISIWGIVLPMSFLAAFRFGWSPVAVLFCLNADQIFKCFVAFIKVNRYSWIKKMTD